MLALISAAARAEEATLPADAPRAEPSVEESTAPEPHPWLALGEVTAINLVVWTYDRTLGQKVWARVSLQTWKDNLRTGFVWDGDGFSTNQFAHPYHGSLYYTAARDNGLSFVSAIPFTLLGSVQWELFAETEPPSINDVINTTMGGVAMGEALYRLSSTVLDTEATGRDRFGRELTAGLISPIRGVNRLLRGDAFRQEPTPSDWRSRALAGWGSVGYLMLGDGKLLAGGKHQFFTQFALRYGDAFRGDIRRPFDAFDAHIQFTTREDSLVSHALLTGLLAAKVLVRTEQDEVRLGLSQQLSYTDTIEYEVGGQSLDVGLLHQHQLSASSKLKTVLSLKGSVLTGISSAHEGREGRNYDYGPGVGVQLRMVYARDAWDVLTLEADMSRVAVLDGAGGSHQVLTGQLQVDVPVRGGVGLGSEVNVFQHHSRFDGFPDVSKDTYELRFFLSVH
ncbi:DUF3943 domain-containing protein [Pyxidicoccus sp. MSG2]|uniref:DUF3943 domain-containing protein n=1 Tax=Pyxidicoccus sp. MSG2 TaxID=2996790 RepID=UPI002270505A|nr:DUF3943 domain-containing protein [Pyxidicoccus sp. MSG2]MCY1022924.1 DUF3943 domain-containing protein [Pyxidicoccus sp. MSG2]